VGCYGGRSEVKLASSFVTALGDNYVANTKREGGEGYGGGSRTERLIIPSGAASRDCVEERERQGGNNATRKNQPLRGASGRTWRGEIAVARGGV